MVLQRGLNYATSHGKKDVLTFIAKVEPVIQDMSSVTLEEKISLRQRVAASVNSAQKANNLSNEDNAALKRLADDDSIVIVPADKGKAIVVMDKLDYVNKIESHLGDSTTYEKLVNNPMQQLQMTINTILKKLKNSNKLS